MLVCIKVWFDNLTKCKYHKTWCSSWILSKKKKPWNKQKTLKRKVTFFSNISTKTLLFNPQLKVKSKYLSAFIWIHLIMPRIYKYITNIIFCSLNICLRYFYEDSNFKSLWMHVFIQVALLPQKKIYIYTHTLMWKDYDFELILALV